MTKRSATTQSAVSLTVTSKGQVTLRKALLAHLGIQPGQRVDVEVLPGGRLEFHAEQATGSTNGSTGLLAGRSARRPSWAGFTDADDSGSAAPPASN